MKISILIPTRKRPHFLERLFKSVQDTADNINDIEVCLYIDNDDTETMVELPRLGTMLNLKTRIGERIILAEMWNKCYKIADPSSQIFQHSNDDITFNTKGWDTLITKAFEKYPDRIAFVGGRDGHDPHNNDLFTHGFLSKQWIETIGYVTPPYFSSDFCDVWLTDVAKMINRFHYIPELYMEHFHPAFGKAPEDSVHQDRIKRHYADNVRQKYDDLYALRLADASKLRNAIERFK